MKYIEVDFENIGKQDCLRLDCKFHYLIEKTNWNILESKNHDLIQLKNILQRDCNIFDYQDEVEYCGIPTGKEYIDEDGQIISYQAIDIDNHPDRLKYYASSDNILISSLRLARSPDFFIEENNEKYVFSNGFYVFKLKENWNKKFIMYILRHKKVKSTIDNCIYRGIGISAYKESDLLQIKIPQLRISTQNEAVAKIEPIEQQIKELKSKIINQKQIINEVFAREFGFDVNLYNEFGKGMTAGTQIAENKTMRIFEIDFSDIANGKTLRFSTRFHNLPTQKLMNILDKIETIAVKDVVREYQKGIQPNYNSDGEIPVVKIANLKDSYIDFSETENITQNDFDVLRNEKKLIKNDIILCATGKISLGKIDYYDYEQEAITTVDNYILRLKENFNPLFFTYFFRH